MGDVLEQEESTTILLFGEVLVDNFIAGGFICESASVFIDKKTVLAFYIPPKILLVVLVSIDMVMIHTVLSQRQKVFRIDIFRTHWRSQ